MPDLDTTWILRLIHFKNLPTLLRRGGLHAPNHVPEDGNPYRGIHDVDVQSARGQRPVSCGPGGVITDYVPFYFGRRSPMLLRLQTGQVAGYTDGQRPILYVVSSVGDVLRRDLGFVFSDGHGLARFTNWYAPAVLGGALPRAAVDAFLDCWRAMMPVANAVPSTLVLFD